MMKNAGPDVLPVLLRTRPRSGGPCGIDRDRRVSASDLRYVLAAVGLSKAHIRADRGADRSGGVACRGHGRQGYRWYVPISRASPRTCPVTAASTSW